MRLGPSNQLSFLEFRRKGWRNFGKTIFVVVFDLADGFTKRNIFFSDCVYETENLAPKQVFMNVLPVSLSLMNFFPFCKLNVTL